MTIRELKEAIKDLPDEMEVIIQKDAEGNDYSPLYDVDSNAVYVPEAPWYGVAFSLGDSAEDGCMTEEEWEEIKKKPKSLILFPIN